MTSEEKRKRLLNLGFRKPVKVAERIITRLKRRSTAYSLYFPESRKLVAKGTAEKFRDAWNRGDLWFLTGAAHQRVRIPPRDLFVEVNGCEYGSRGEVGLADSIERPNDRLLKLHVSLRSTAPMKVSTVQLVIGATVIEPFEPDTLDLDAIYGERRIPSGEVDGLDSFSPLFSVPTFLAKGRQTAQLLVQSNQKVWGTEVFEVDFDRAGHWIETPSA